jgi:hypothetical protein
MPVAQFQRSDDASPYRRFHDWATFCFCLLFCSLHLLQSVRKRSTKCNEKPFSATLMISSAVSLPWQVPNAVKKELNYVLRSFLDGPLSSSLPQSQRSLTTFRESFFCSSLRQHKFPSIRVASLPDRVSLFTWDSTEADLYTLFGPSSSLLETTKPPTDLAPKCKTKSFLWREWRRWRRHKKIVLETSLTVATSKWNFSLYFDVNSKVISHSGTFVYFMVNRDGIIKNSFRCRSHRKLLTFFSSLLSLAPSVEVLRWKLLPEQE